MAPPPLEVESSPLFALCTRSYAQRPWKQGTDQSLVFAVAVDAWRERIDEKARRVRVERDKEEGEVAMCNMV